MLLKGGDMKNLEENRAAQRRRYEEPRGERAAKTKGGDMKRTLRRTVLLKGGGMKRTSREIALLKGRNISYH